MNLDFSKLLGAEQETHEKKTAEVEPERVRAQNMDFWTCFILITTLAAGLIPYRDDTGSITARRLCGEQLTPEESETISDRAGELAAALDTFNLADVIETYCRGEDFSASDIWDEYGERLGYHLESGRRATQDEILTALSDAFTAREMFLEWKNRAC